MKFRAAALRFPRFELCSWESPVARASAGQSSRSGAAARTDAQPRPVRGRVEGDRERSEMSTRPWAMLPCKAAAERRARPPAPTAAAATQRLPLAVLFSIHLRIQSGCLQTWAEAPSPPARVDTAALWSAPGKAGDVRQHFSELWLRCWCLGLVIGSW